MPTATLTTKGQVVIPAAIRQRYGLTAGTQVEFVDTGEQITLKICRRVPASDAAAGYGMFKVDPARKSGRNLADFDVADAMRRNSRAP